MISLYTLDNNQMKEIIYQFSKWATVMKVEPWHANFDDMVEMVSLDCKRQLSRKVEDFIKIEVDKDIGEVKGTIYLPYIRDEEIKTLNSLLDLRRKELFELRHKVTKFELLPWYKRLWTEIR